MVVNEVTRAPAAFSLSTLLPAGGFTAKVAALLVTEPAVFVTTQVNVEPESPMTVMGVV